ncbi:MAG: pirin family protein [Hyalangium sp.]|uniref:pirin family protein n=1 Tax=Hyalangium sp. TaxID=2028555 RepID=UPI00389A5553
MSSNQDVNPLPDELEAVIIPRTRDLGDGLQVRRALPSNPRQMVGPFIFFDQIGPSLILEGHGLDVRPHPHIGLATVTYLIEGAILHRDSLGTVARIVPGELNWMTAGRGIVHSERSPQEERTRARPILGTQLWVALPKKDEETEPSFSHFGADPLPVIEDTGLRMRLVIGSLFGARSPVRTFSEMFYADVSLDEGAALTLKPEHDERAAYVLQGSIQVGSTVFQAGEMLVFNRRGEALIRAQAQSRVILLGGEPMDGPRHLYWNLVSSSPERIQQAKEDWKAERFPKVPGETEFIPLPDDPPPPVVYP